MSRQNNQDHPGLPGNIRQRLRNVPLRGRLPAGRNRPSDAWWRAANSRPGMAVRNRAYVIRHSGAGRAMTNVRNNPAGTPGGGPDAFRPEPDRPRDRSSVAQQSRPPGPRYPAAGCPHAGEIPLNRPQSRQHARIRKAWRDAGMLPAGPPRRGTPGQVHTYKDAHKDLFRDSRYEAKLRTADGKRAIRDETPRYLDLNDRAYRSGAPLSRVQRWWHRHRTAGAEDRDFTRVQRAPERQDRTRRVPRWCW